ncbi:MAG: aspartate kinase [Turicibacter sp.]|nr:aspartate kinase [Turicibacter sp.]
MLIVTKFGGSSLSWEAQFKKVKNIVASDPNRRVVVVSALGRRQKEDNKMTDLLYLIAAHIRYGVTYDAMWETIVARFIAVKEELGLSYDVAGELEELRQDLSQKSLNEEFLVSRGEYFTAKLVAEYLGYQFLDAKDVIAFQPNGTVDLTATQTKLQAAVPDDERVVIPGFYGAFPSGAVKLFNRGGSDITGAIVASCLGAKTYENWTDVSGVLMADPRIIDNPVSVAQLSYEELSELSYMGASVLHEETIYPIRSLNIPIHIKNTNDPAAAGTVISDEDLGHPQRISGISGKKDFVSLTIYKSQMSTELGFLRRALAIFERFKLNVEHLPTGIDHVGIVISGSGLNNQLDDLVQTLKEELNADEVVVKKDISLITIVGASLIGCSQLTASIFTALAKSNIGVQLIAQSPREVNMIIGVANEDYLPAITALYEELVS